MIYLPGYMYSSHQPLKIVGLLTHSDKKEDFYCRCRSFSSFFFEKINIRRKCHALKDEVVFLIVVHVHYFVFHAKNDGFQY